MHQKKNSTMHSSTTTTTFEDSSANSTNNNLAILGLPLSTLQTSFFKSSTTTSNHFHKLVTQSSNHLMHNIHNSFHKCITFLHLFASENPLFVKFHSLSSEYHNFCQVNFRNQRNLKSVSNHDFAAIIPGDSMAGLVVSNGVLNFLNLYNTLLVVRLVLTWFPNTPPAIVTPLSTLCDPYLNIFRGVIPPLGGTLDLSPILAFLVLNALTSTASALPAELPSTESPEKGPSTQTNPSFHAALSHLTSTQKKWMKRFDTKTANGSSIDD